MFDGCVLGAVRLAVVDVDDGAQPMVGPNRAVVFNGEVYGHRRLRAGLDWSFATDCDTEVVLALSDRHGDGLAVNLPGMFALAVWDDARRQLYCARDRFGEKPFYWSRGPDGEFVFASEVGALLASGLVSADVDRSALAHYVRHSYVHPSTSIYAGVEVLPPAHELTVERGRVRTRRYWDLQPVRRHIDPTEAADTLRHLLDGAVADQLEADVPVGAFLSGGVDSSTVVALAAARHPAIHTFSMRVGTTADETPFAEAQAARHGTTHHSIATDGKDLVEVLKSLPKVYGEPFADSSAVPTYLLSRAAREHVKVALTGDGADELLGGYLFWARGFLRDTGLLQSPAGPQARWSLRSRRLSRSDRLTRAYTGFRSYVDDAQLRALALPSATDGNIDFSRYASGRLMDLLRFDAEGYLPGDILVKTDRASMAHGLELRSPFLDTTVAEFCLSLPDELNVDDHAEKLVLRAAFEEEWAPAIRRRDKQGFGVPMDDWLALPTVRTLIEDIVSDRNSALFDLVAPEGVAPLFASGGQAAWTMLMLALWAAEAT